MPAQLDFDKIFGDRIQKNLEAAVIVDFKLGGRTWHATNTASEVSLLALAGGDDPTSYLYSLVVDDEREQFKDMLKGFRGFDRDMTVELINTVTEKLASVPTAPQSTSRVTSRKRTSGARSTAD